MALKETKFIWMDGKFEKWNNVKIGNGKGGEVTAKVRDKCYNIVRGKDRKYNKWLTYI